jgi:hypothetical protein
MPLELGDLAADVRDRHAELARRRRKAAGLDDGQKHRHGFEAIQRPASFSIIEKVVLKQTR